jgi:site-specific DNA-methyltransferase (adenine-specific)
MEVTDKIQITNEDNMALMSRYPDKYFDLAIVDPPYGIGVAKYDYFAFKGGKRATKGIRNKSKDWDDQTPTDEYWKELFRVSKNQIVWGANYYSNVFPVSRGWLAWDKKHPDNVSFSQFEIAWTSFDKINKMFRMYPTHVAQGVKIHPTQKPIALYKWILDKYAKQGDKILDTHLGSGSIAIACHDYNFELTACELDKEYFDKAIERIKNHTAQIKIF